MAWGTDDWLKNGLPTFSGMKDKTLARKFIDNLGGPIGFRKTEQMLPDGSFVRVTLRGDMPPHIDYAPATKEVVIAGDYIEVDYAQRVLEGAPYDRLTWMTSTPLMGEKVFNNKLIKDGEDEYLWEAQPPMRSTDGLLEFQLRRHIKKGWVTGAEGRDLFFPSEPVRTFFDALHTIRGGFHEVFYRFRPVKNVAASVDNQTKVLVFKPPPNTITYTTMEGLNPFDDVLVFGNPLHGRYSENGLTLENGDLHPDKKPPPVLPNYTYYMNFGLPAAPFPTDKEVAAGMKWYNDAVLSGFNRQVTTGTVSLGRNWIYRDPTGFLHTLEVYASNAASIPDPDGSGGYLLQLRVTVIEYLYNPSTGTMQPYYHVDEFAGVDYGSPVFWKLTTTLIPPKPPTWGSWSGEIAEQAALSFIAGVPSVVDNAWKYFSPDGKKCCVNYRVSDFTGYVRAAIELEASGGNGSLSLADRITVTARNVAELADHWYASIAASGDTGTVFTDRWEPAGSWTVLGMASSAMYLGYSKDSQLQIQSAQRLYERTFKKQIDDDVVSISDDLHEKISYTIDGVNVLAYEKNYSYNSTIYSPTNTVLSSTTNENTTSYPRQRTVVRPTDTLTLLIDRNNPANEQKIAGAYAYGETVEALIGETLPSPLKIAYNPRTGEVAFGTYAGFI